MLILSPVCFPVFSVSLGCACTAAGHAATARALVAQTISVARWMRRCMIGPPGVGGGMREGRRQWRPPGDPPGGVLLEPALTLPSERCANACLATGRYLPAPVLIRRRRRFVHRSEATAAAAAIHLPLGLFGATRVAMYVAVR